MITERKQYLKAIFRDANRKNNRNNLERQIKKDKQLYLKTRTERKLI